MLRVVALAALVAAVAVTQLTGAGAAPVEANAQIKAAAADLHGLDVANLAVLTRTTSNFALTGVSMTNAKVLDHATGRTYGVSLDASGQAVDYAAAQRAELAAREARFGTMTPELSGLVESSSPGDVLEVAFWLHSNHNSVVRRDAAAAKSARGETAVQLVEAEEAANDQRVQQAVEAVVAPFAADLRAGGHKVDLPAPLSPLVIARVRASDVARLAADSRVQATSFAGARAVDTMNVAKFTTAASRIWGGNKTITGAGVTGGVVECCDSLFEEDVNDFDAENNVYLGRFHELRPIACGGNHSHPTAVTGIVQSTHHVFTGIAKDARVVFDSSCTGSQAEVISAAQDVSAVVNGATNHSYGISQSGTEPCPNAENAMNRALDDLVRNGADSQYVAAGNDGNAICVGPPGTAWNIVTVGAWDDKNSGTWSGDTMATFSSGGDPGSDSGDRSKPEVAGPGVNFVGLLPSPGGGPTGNIGSGTSYAAPVYTGGALLASQKAPILMGWPEAEKAVMLASACHNIEGTQTNSALDGAGGPDFLETWRLLHLNRFTFGSIANGAGVAVTQPFDVFNGQEIRAAVAYDTNTSYAAYATDPSMDLDLLLRRPNGTLAAASSSFDNPYEVLEFVADVSGTWTLEVNRFRTSDPAGSTFFGLAWHNVNPANCTSP